VAAVVCTLAALCHAEFVSTVPVAGSAYTFSDATICALIAWIIGWWSRRTGLRGRHQARSCSWL
jgi:amino acid transporter